MAIDFNRLLCVTTTNESIFGICDDPPPSQLPAYLDFVDSEKWVAWVGNDAKKTIKFTAIDHCIEILRTNGEQESSCDGMLQYDTNIVFVELKDRDSGRWLGKARDQLKITIQTYANGVGLEVYDKKYAYVSNKQRPYFYAASTAIAAEFEDETGFVLLVEQVIKID